MTLYGHEPVSRKKEKNCSKGNVTTAVKGKRLKKKEKKKEKDE